MVMVAAGCQNHLYDFGVSVVPGDGSAPVFGRGGSTDAGQTGGFTGAGGTPFDAGTGGTVGAGGMGGRTGTGGTSSDGGVPTCNPNSPALQTDPSNCGTCFHQCIVANAEPSCVAGKCQFACEPGFYDADGDPSNGCECSKSNGGVEICDGIDNDCDGTVDNTFDLMTDVENCGSCNHACAFPFAMASCVNGKCQQGACLPDFYDRDPNVPGCEAECIKTNGGVEICDGLDNDCDGVIDDNLGAATTTCLSKGVCSGTKPVCTGGAGWVCTYPSTYEPVEDTKFGCDGLDNDCNGQTDEPFQIGKSCIVGSGPCAGTGTWVCDNSSAGNHKCMGSMKAAQPEICDGIDNDCDGLVDELDSASNRTTDDVLVVVPAPTGTVTMYAYEASRYDATATSAGFDSTRRGCTVPNRLPWTNVTMSEAEHACELLGPNWRVCTAAEWQFACQGANATTFPYGNTYVPTDCNGNDYAIAMGVTPAPIPGGTAVGGACVSVTSAGGKLFDMSGNVKEWTATDLTTKNPSSNPGCTTPPCLFEMRGGAYDITSFTVAGTTTAPGLQCNSSVAAPYSTTTTADGGTTTQGIDVRLPSVGFRCCLPGMLPK